MNNAPCWQQSQRLIIALGAARVVQAMAVLPGLCPTPAAASAALSKNEGIVALLCSGRF